MIQVLERTLPDSGTGLAQWWATHGTHDTSWASTTYSELIDRAGPAGERHATTLSLSLDMKAAVRQIRTAGGGIRRGAAVLRQEMNTLTAALRFADLAPSAWLTCGQIAVTLRSAYDPAIAATLERHGELGQNLATAGPVAVNESWNRLRTDSAHHAVLWISEWPRSMVYPGFLAPILLSTGIQRSFSLLCTPMRSDQAARDIRRKKNRVHLRRRPTPENRADRRRQPDRRIPRRPPTRSRPHRRPRHPPLHRPHLRLRHHQRRPRHRHRHHRTSRHPSLLRNTPPRRPTSPSLHRSRTATVPGGVRELLDVESLLMVLAVFHPRHFQFRAVGTHGVHDWNSPGGSRLKSD
ncbi:hypothetical protein HMPREF1485_00253 [Propionibacterium sp. HGH0353]|nr:hypothetical protein HMPREF1485_00253 [Propionibacterium sp. HGH0353]